jgi:polyphosphate kinase
VYNKELQNELKEILQLQLEDTKKAVFFKSDYSNERITFPDTQASIAAQESIYQFVKKLNGD